MKNLQAFMLCAISICLASCSGATSSLPTGGSTREAAQPLAQESLLHSFTGSPDGAFPYAGLLAGNHGELYGVTNGGGTAGPSGLVDGTVFEVSTTGTEQILYDFQGGNDGAGTEAGLISDSSGDLFGATQAGGGSTACTNGCGTVFELQPKNGGFKERVLHAFTGGDDGELPLASLLLGKNGVLYGTTTAGGTTGCSSPSGVVGCGTVFSLTPAGRKYHEEILYRFQGGRDGESPRAKLAADGKGDLIGTTEFGGNGNSACSPGPSGNTSCGTAFRLTLTGKKTTLYRFKGGDSDGSNPRAGLLQLANKSFVGLTVFGGSAKLGSAYELTPSGKSYVERVLYFFGQTSTDGGRPFDADGLVADARGNLYGTTFFSLSSPCSCGTVFKLKPSGSGYSESVIHSFTANLTDGGAPFSGVVLSGGELYGTTYFGGSYCYGSSNSCGTVYKVRP